MQALKLVSAAIALLMVLGFGACDSCHAQEKVTLRFGTLPVLQALPLYVAQAKNLYTAAGVKVEIVPFSGAAEKEIALIAGSIDGSFGDLVTPTVLVGNGQDVRIVATNYDTRQDRRMFAVLGKPAGSYRGAADLAGVPVAIASNSVVDIVTERLLVAAGVPKEKIQSVETKNIGLRMQMLLSGQVEAATLPEPLATAAVAKGAVVLADDAGLALSQTVLAFRGPFLRKHPEAVTAFLRAVNEANRIIEAEPDLVRKVMVEHVMLPEPLKATYPLPKFPDTVRAPDKETVIAVAQWLKNRGVIPKELSYEQIVDAGRLP